MLSKHLAVVKYYRLVKHYVLCRVTGQHIMCIMENGICLLMYLTAINFIVMMK